MKLSSLSLSPKLFAVFTLMGLTVVFFTALILYSAAIDTEYEELQSLSQNHAKLINAVAIFDQRYNSDYPDGGARGATFSQIINAHFEEIGFGETGEFAIGDRKDNKLHFVIPSRILGSTVSPVDVMSRIAEPMRNALIGRSGFISGLDYRNQPVIAWYEPIPALDAGFVAKIDIAELRQPYLSAITTGSLVAVIVSLLAALTFHQIEIRFTSKSSHQRSEKKFQKTFLKRQGILYLTLIACLISISGITVVTVAGLVYSTEIEHRKSELASLTKGMAAMIGSVASFDAKITPSAPDKFTLSRDATISQIKESVKFKPGFGKTGEIVLGIKSDNTMQFILPSRFTGALPPQVNLNGTAAEPMRRAIQGQNGVIEGLDYRNKKVLAAFHPIKLLEGGLVAKMDLNEIRQPYFIAGSINVSLAIFTVVFGIMLAPQFIETMKVRETDTLLVPSGVGPVDDFNTRWRQFSLALIIGLCGLLFILDTKTQLGLAAGIPYIGLIIVGSFVTERKGLLWLASIATILVFAGFAVAPNEGVLLWLATTNRVYPVLTIWLAVVILLRIKNTEQSLRQSERRLVQILESLPDATLLVRPEGHIIFASQQAEHLLEYTRADLIGLNVEALVPESIHKKHSKLRKLFLTENDARPMSRNTNIVTVTRTGKSVPVSISLSPVDTGSGTAIVVIMRNVTDLRRQEEDLARHASELERSNEELQHFAYATSHDLQEPLRKIQAFSERLAVHNADTLDEKGHLYLDRIVSSTARMRILIDDLLSFSRVTSNTRPFTEINLSDLVHYVLDDLETAIEQSGAKITVSAMPILQCDQTQMRQLLQNLISNAMKFSRTDVPLVIDVQAQTTATTTRITISDNGIGFESKFASRIFGLFERLHGRSEYSGTGIGLATCKKIAERHKGSIVATGTPGEGAVFTVTLPIKQEEEG